MFSSRRQSENNNRAGAHPPTFAALQAATKSAAFQHGNGGSQEQNQQFMATMQHPPQSHQLYQLNYSIVYKLSQDERCPARNLLLPATQTSQGWKSAKFCSYPQELILQFTNIVNLKQIKFLVHESAIPQRLDLYTFVPSGSQAQTAQIPLNQVDFQRLGYLNLNSNEGSQYCVRELKSVYTDCMTLLLKVVLNAPYSNEYNQYNQVGLIAITCMGQMLMPSIGSATSHLNRPHTANLMGQSQVSLDQHHHGNYMTQQSPQAASVSQFDRQVHSIFKNAADQSPQASRQGKRNSSAQQPYRTVYGPPGGVRNKAVTLEGQQQPHAGGSQMKDYTSHLRLEILHSEDSGPIAEETSESHIETIPNEHDVQTNLIGRGGPPRRPAQPVPGIVSKVADQIRLLTSQKMQAVEMENYDEAQRLKTIVDALTAIKDDVERLEMQKLEAVQDERYDDAKRFKLQVEGLLSAALRPSSIPYSSQQRLDEAGYDDRVDQQRRPYHRQQNNWQLEDRKVPLSDSLTHESGIFDTSEGRFGRGPSAGRMGRNEHKVGFNIDSKVNESMTFRDRRDPDQSVSENVLWPSGAGNKPSQRGQFSSYQQHNSTNQSPPRRRQHSVGLQSDEHSRSLSNQRRPGSQRKRKNRIIDGSFLDNDQNESRFQSSNVQATAYDDQVIPALAAKNKNASAEKSDFDKGGDGDDLSPTATPADTQNVPNKEESKIFMTEDQKIMVEPWNAVFGAESIKLLFSKKFQDKEKGLQECENVLKSPNFIKNKETLKIACLVANLAIKDKFLTVNLKGISLLETTLMEHQSLQFEGSGQLVSRTLFNDLFSKVGDQNSRLKESTEDIILQMSASRLVGWPFVLSYATKVPIETATKPKQAIGRLQLVNKLIEKHAHTIQDPSLLSQAVSFSKGGFKHQNSDVRGQSYHVMLECYKTLGRDIKSHLSGLRIAQQEMLEKGFAKIDEERMQGQLPEEITALHALHAAAVSSEDPRSLSPTVTQQRPRQGSLLQQPTLVNNNNQGTTGSSGKPSVGGERSGSVRQQSTQNSFIGQGTTNIHRIQQLQQYKAAGKDEQSNVEETSGPISFDPSKLMESQPLQKDDHFEGEHAQQLTSEIEETKAAIVPPSAKCEFCNENVTLTDVVGAVDAETINDALDIHYIEACKMLTSCVACDKVVEISGLSEHMISQCEHRDKVKKCESCGQVAIDLESHTCPE